MRKKCYWLFTIHTDNMLSDVLDPTRVLYVLSLQDVFLGVKMLLEIHGRGRKK